MKKLISKDRVRTWLLLMGSSTLILGAVYTMVQQSSRLGASDAPHRTADMAKRLLNDGGKPTSAVPGYATHLPTDSSTFLTITDKSQNVLATNLMIEGAEQIDSSILPPTGVFDYATAHGHDSVSWQPFSNTRAVIYVEPYDKGFVVAGQSLKPFEDRYNTYLAITASAWLAILIWTTLVILL